MAGFEPKWAGLTYTENGPNPKHELLIFRVFSAGFGVAGFERLELNSEDWETWATTPIPIPTSCGRVVLLENRWRRPLMEP